MPSRNQARAVMSASWLYPFKGLYYFVSHPFLYPLFRARLVPITLLSAFIYTNLFLWTYLPQVAFLHFFHGPGAWVNGAFLVLGEGATIVALLFECFFADEALVDCFDAVLINEGCESLVAQGRIIEPADDFTKLNPVKRLGKPTQTAVYSPFSLRQIVEFVILLPLNFIPVAGTPMFLVLTGYRAGPFHHWRYFKLMDLSKKERKLAIKKRQLRYTWFGTVSLLLQLVPVLSMLFLLTTAAGSALWVVDIEKQKASRSDQIVESGEQYRDEDV